MKKKKKKSTIKNVIEIIGAVSATTVILAFVLDFFGIWDIGKTMPSIYMDNISISYLNNDNRNENIYHLFSDEIDNSKEYKFSESCATQIYITNHYEQEIVLNSIKFVAQDITLIENPVISLHAMEGMGYIDLSISNVGWEDSKKLEFEFSGVDKNLNEYIKNNKLFLTIDGIKTGENKTVRLWENDDLISKTNSDVINFTAKCRDIDGNEVQVIYFSGNSQYLSVDINEGKFLNEGKGGPSDSMYGVCIDTSKSFFSYKDSIEEYILPNETLTLPICFYPDKSCTMTFYVEFTAVHDGKEITIKSDPITLEFEVLSIGGNGIYDATEYSEYDLKKISYEERGFCLVSYPFIDKFAIQVLDELAKQYD